MVEESIGSRHWQSGAGGRKHPLWKKRAVRFQERTAICGALPVLGDYMCYFTPKRSQLGRDNYLFLRKPKFRKAN